MKNFLTAGALVSLVSVAARPALAQTAPQPAAQPIVLATPLPAPSDEQSYRRETVFGINFNTQGGLIGGVNVRSSRVLDDRWLRFWSLEGVFFKNAKEETVTNPYTGGSFTGFKTNYAFALRPSFGIQRILFRKAAESGVQINSLLSAGPSLGLLMPYYISYDYDAARSGQFRSDDNVVNEQYDPSKHTVGGAIVDRAPFFSGIGGTKIVPGAHIRGALSFEYGRYRDAVAGAEVGFLVEAYTKRLITLDPSAGGVGSADINALNKQFFPSVYLTLYLGHRS
jgi:hypothetical protein